MPNPGILPAQANTLSSGVESTVACTFLLSDLVTDHPYLPHGPYWMKVGNEY